jgi:hypothetical protein
MNPYINILRKSVAKIKTYICFGFMGGVGSSADAFEKKTVSFFLSFFKVIDKGIC